MTDNVSNFSTFRHVIVEPDTAFKGDYIGSIFINGDLEEIRQLGAHPYTTWLARGISNGDLRTEAFNWERVDENVFVIDVYEPKNTYPPEPERVTRELHRPLEACAAPNTRRCTSERARRTERGQSHSCWRARRARRRTRGRN